MFEYQCKIVKVIDGDTADVDIDLGFGVWMKKQRVRFYGIDTPESRTSDKEEKVYGLLAKEFVQSYLPLESTQVLRTKKDGVGKHTSSTHKEGWGWQVWPYSWRVRGI